MSDGWLISPSLSPSRSGSDKPPQVDYTLFNNTYEVDTPLCSARELSEMRAESQSQQGEAGESLLH